MRLSTDSSGSGQDPVVASCEQANGLSFTKIMGNILDDGEYQLNKMLLHGVTWLLMGKSQGTCVTLEIY